MTDTRARELIDCIRFYADEDNYVPHKSKVMADKGLRARSFLAQFFEAAE